jgi:hypothetical protein
MTDPTSPRTLALRDLPLAARLTLAVFLISVGIGYTSALVQLHFQHATPGSIMPTGENTVDIFHGKTTQPMSKLQILLEADPSRKFNGSGQMSAAFTDKDANWEQAISERADAIAPRRKEQGDALLTVAEQDLRKERDGERLALIGWLQNGAHKREYDQDAYPLPPTFGNQPITEKYLAKKGVAPAEPPVVKIRSIVKDRCVRCHREAANNAASKFPLDTFERLHQYIPAQSSTAMSLNKLAQTTHVHLLGFSMLYGLTGLILAFSSYPRVLRVVLCPLPLLAQVVDIGLWWLARLDEPYGPQFARAIVITGGIVGGSLFLHIVLSLWDLFRWQGRFTLILLAAAAGYGGYVAKEKVIDPYMAQEAKPAAVQE